MHIWCQWELAAYVFNISYAIVTLSSYKITFWYMCSIFISLSNAYNMVQNAYFPMYSLFQQPFNSSFTELLTVRIQ